MIPQWLHILAIASLVFGGLCLLVVLADVIRHPQRMWIMNIVWPVVALFGTALSVWADFQYGRLATRRKVMAAKEREDQPPKKRLTPFGIMVAKGTLHCGGGCTLGDICAEWLAALVPAVAVAFGWKWLFAADHKIFAVWIVDFIFAFLFGIAFQYFTIKPMRNLSPGQGLIQAVKADTLSLTAWQVGMYGFMAVAHFWIFGTILNHELHVPTPEFWFMMQLAMLCGFVTSYPVNWWLLKSGIKERM